MTVRAADFRARLLEWSRHNGRDFPWRQPGRSPYEVLIAEALLKRTTATAAARIYEDFLRDYPTPDDLAGSDIGELEVSLSSIGLHRQRARGLKAAAKYIVEHGIGSGVAELRQIPHVGHYAAAAIESFAHGEPAAIVDSNVERVLRRVFKETIPTSSTRELQALADDLLPARQHRDYNLAMLDFGALVCRYIRPKCPECPLASLCDSAPQ